jgi:site-specific recombinase
VIPGDATAVDSDYGTIYDRIRALYPEPAANHPELRHLAASLSILWQAPTVRESIDALVDLVHWTRVPDDSLPRPGPAEARPPLSSSHGRTRLDVLVDVLESCTDLRQLFESWLAAFLSDAKSVALFADAGLSTDRGLLAEMSERIARRLLPVPLEDEDLSRVLVRLFPSEREADRFHSVTAEQWERAATVFATDNPERVWAPVQSGMCDAVRILAARVQALALSERLRTRLATSLLAESPFYRLSRRLDVLLDAVDTGRGVQEARLSWEEVLGECRCELTDLTRRLESTGVNLDIVYSQDVMGKSLDRMETIAAVLCAPPGPVTREAVRSLLEMLIHARASDRSLTQLWRTNLRLLATKIVEHAGKTGEHYIARDRHAYWVMWKAGLWGGALTAVTAAVKMVVTHRGLPLFVEGFLAGLNYAVSFVLIQVWHFALATKQPSATAAAFAGIVRSKKGGDRLEEMTSFIARICSSQLAAAIANVIAVTICASLLATIWAWVRGKSYLTAEESLHLFETLDPLRSGTAVYAALTGVILWFSSIVGGWIDNWATYRKLPQALAEHPLGMRWGREPFERLARVLAPNVAAWGGSIALGFMLGMVPPIGRFFGVPLDVRHVTLTTGTWALATASLRLGAFQRDRFYRALPGIAVMFVLNLTVSFSISLLVALRAYDIPVREHVRLLKTVLVRLVRRPGEFLLAPRSTIEEHR